MELRQTNPRRQGDIGEAAAIQWFTELGATVCFPLFHSPDFDLVADIDGELFRVQVKTSSCAARGNYVVSIATRGGNQSWSGLVKRFDASRCDLLFVLVADGRRWCIPAPAVEARNGMTLGGTRYSEFEIPPESGKLFPHSASLECRSRWGSAGAGEPGRTVNPVALPEWVRFPPPPSQRRNPLGAPRGGDSHSATTRVSRNHQITIPKRPFAAAGLSPGDRLRIQVERAGEIFASRIDGVGRA